MTENKLIEFSKIHLKRLAKKSFKQEVLEPSSKRVKAFMPLYCAINKSYGYIFDPDMLEKVAMYIRILNKQIPTNDIYNQFIKSLDSHYYIIKEREKQNKESLQKIYDLIEKYKISSYKLIKEYNVNAKIANEIINKKDISMSLSKKLNLLKSIEQKHLKASK